MKTGGSCCAALWGLVLMLGWVVSPCGAAPATPWLAPVVAQASADAEPMLYVAPVDELRPTQLTVGMREVEEKIQKLQHLMEEPEKLTEYLKSKPEPVVLGPGKQRYIIDHHHLGTALHRLGIKRCYCTVVADLSDLDEAEFWKTMESRHWVYLYDENGVGPHPPADLPRTVEGLRDDPFRSLAGDVRSEGGYAKTSAPFAEFLWAGFFRHRIDLPSSSKEYHHALKKALDLCHSREAEQAHLPGFSRTPVKD